MVQKKVAHFKAQGEENSLMVPFMPSTFLTTICYFWLEDLF